MKSLNRSLPKSGSTKPPEQLLQAFKSAALSVTNLYKTAAADQVQARRLGYQDALDNLLGFLDKENLGLGDGEGWKVRQWATERLDGHAPVPPGSESDEDRGEIIKRVRSSSPVLQRKSSPEISEVRLPSRSASPVRSASVVPVQPTSPQPSNVSAGVEIFSFRSPHPYPQDIEMQADAANITPQSEPQPQDNGSNSITTARVEAMPRVSKISHRGGNHPSRHNTRSATSSRSLGTGAGSKRRVAFNDYFDLASLGDGKDIAGGSNKRGKFA